MNNCPLCQAIETADFFKDKKRQYIQCLNCSLVFVPDSQHVTMEAEKAEYDLHRNSPDDSGYRQFLSRLFTPLQNRLSPISSGLDFGCGPGPTLSVMLEEAGHKMTVYDKFYAPNQTVFNQLYDFITATEVVEHLHNPKQELNRLWQCLKPGGLLGIMTKLVIDQAAFANWHYKNDVTHICFYSKATFEWLAKKWQAELTFAAKDVIVFRKKKVLC